MAKPPPVGGLVMRYDYLWVSEAAQGREEGSKNRPCSVVVAVATERAPLRAIMCGITHSAPTPPAEGLAIPAGVGRHLGFDDDQSWIITSEVNVVDWDDPGIIPVAEGQWEYGILPAALATQVRARILARFSANKLPMADRPAIEKKRDRGD